MATKKPILFPDNTCLPELLGHAGERGILVKSGATPQELTVNQMDNDRIRATTDIEDMVNKMEHLIEHRADYQPMIDRAYEFAAQKSWWGNEIGSKWRGVFDKAWTECQKDRELAAMEIATNFSKLGRNDECPVCSTMLSKPIKFKNCPHYERINNK